MQIYFCIYTEHKQYMYIFVLLALWNLLIHIIKSFFFKGSLASGFFPIPYQQCPYVYVYFGKQRSLCILCCGLCDWGREWFKNGAITSFRITVFLMLWGRLFLFLNFWSDIAYFQTLSFFCQLHAWPYSHMDQIYPILLNFQKVIVLMDKVQIPFNNFFCVFRWDTI